VYLSLKNSILVIFVLPDTHFNQFSFGSTDVDTNGIVALIHQSGSFPMTIDKSFDIRTGHNNLITLSGKLVNSNTIIRALDLNARNCSFEDENGNSTLFQKYSRSHCMFDCALRIAQTALMIKNNKSKMSDICIPWFIPSPEQSLNICDPWDSKFIYEMMMNVSSSKCTHCLADCSSTIYEGRLTAVRLRKCTIQSTGVTQFCSLREKSLVNQNMLNSYLRSQYQHYRRAQPYFMSKYFPSTNRIYSVTLPQGDIFGRTEYDPFITDVAKVQVYFQYATMTMINSQNTLTWIDFFSNIGGIFGLILGMGIISLFEFLFLGLRFFF
jgi:hypothetical protein